MKFKFEKIAMLHITKILRECVFDKQKMIDRQEKEICYFKNKILLFDLYKNL